MNYARYKDYTAVFESEGRGVSANYRRW